MNEETTEGQETIDVVADLETAPPVSPSGTVGEVSQAEMVAYAESLLRGQGYEVSRRAEQKEGTIPGTDIPLDVCPEWEELTDGEQKAVKSAWRIAQKQAQVHQEVLARTMAPSLRKAGIEAVCEGLDARTASVVPQMIKEMEDDSGSMFGLPPGGFSPTALKNLQAMAKGRAADLPKESPKVGKEPATDTTGISLTEDERTIQAQVKEMYGVEWSAEKVRDFMKNGAKTTGFVRQGKN